MSRILLGVSGGVAAYKALELVRLASAAGHSLRVVQTPTSRRFVGPASFAALTGAPVLASEFERDPARGAFPGQRPPEHEPLGHLELVANADVYVIAPATANTIAKLAHGLADNLLGSCALAATCPLVLAPAMNNRMYEHPATQANLRALAERGVVVVEPDTGRLASHGEQGVGRLAEPARILAVCEATLAGAGGEVAASDGSAAVASGADRRWGDLKVLVTAGGTREPIDSVRFLGNSSSGRMGLALASAAMARGAQVTVVAANVALAPVPGAVWCEVATAAELQQACEREFPACDVLLMAAAVADFRPKAAREGKIKKHEHARLELELEPTADVLAGLSGRRRNGQTLVGFAAEHGPDGLAQAERKLRDKRLDALVVNDISRADIGFGAEHNEVAILTARGRDQIPRAAKHVIAEAILDTVARLRAEH
ncbi:MAG TPA: bifunctional phosphopantothenoylcysteine decarboxylase/phosphopantothenate--cysteine ligase CoaBC [Solirubrobacteraceae bacterium]|nr:bifunctional phosphopantothenoylcysteine decarboxylase/phosphopantothenate--cysteine ligase CoaBC [Solirubrobacteraceae bacterium]